MKTINTYYTPSPDMKYTNFGDILTPFILQFANINVKHDSINPLLYGIGSLLHMIPDNYTGYIWTSGMMYNTKFLNMKHNPIAVRGKLTLKQFRNDISNTFLGDGGLLLETYYKPKLHSTIPRYKLGIMPNYVDIVNMNDNPIHNFNIFKNYNPDILLIDPRNYIETVVQQLLLCDNILTSSLHGIITCDSYNINHGIFRSRETNLAIHQLQDAFKFRDYYSIYDINFEKNKTLYLDNNTTFEQCLSSCKPVNKPQLENIKYGLTKSIEQINSIAT